MTRTGSKRAPSERWARPRMDARTLVELSALRGGVCCVVVSLCASWWRVLRGGVSLRFVVACASWWRLSALRGGVRFVVACASWWRVLRGGGVCFLAVRRSSNGNRIADSSATSGSCRAPAPPAPPCDASGHKCVYYDDGSDPATAAALAATADVAIVFTSTTSSEGGDRSSLSYDGNADKLVAAVAAAAKKTVVAGVAPGAYPRTQPSSTAASLNAARVHASCTVRVALAALLTLAAPSSRAC
jgi:hypothetical protein